MKKIVIAMLLVFTVGKAVAQTSWLADWHNKMQAIIPKGYVCHHTDQPMKIDGNLDAAAWTNAAWTDDFVDIEGDAKPKPRFRTRVKMLWDDQYLYVAAELEEPDVWATLTNHDSVIFRDPDFEVFINPSGSTHDYYEFEINALNTYWDLLLPKPYKDGGPPHNEWEIPGIKTAIHVRGTLNDPSDRDAGWNVELAFPWKALAGYAHRVTPPLEGDQWRINFSRVEWQIQIIAGKYVKIPNTHEDNWVWTPQGVVDMHRPEKWGYLQFTRQSGAVEFKPDPAAPARDALQEVYYTQKDFFNQHNHWAATFDELGLAVAQHGNVGIPILRATPGGYECSVELQCSNAVPQLWVIQQDSRVWRMK